jgi:hypothetical protein
MPFIFQGPTNIAATATIAEVQDGGLVVPDAEAQAQVESENTNQPIHLDPDLPAQNEVAKFEAILGNIDSRAAAEESLHELSETQAENMFKRGGFLAKLQTNPKWWNESYANFKQYTEKGLGIRYWKAMRAIDLYRRLLGVGLPYSAFGGIGWTKVSLLAKIVTKDNVADWVEKAKAMNVSSLQAAIRQAVKAAPGVMAPANTSECTIMTFELAPDQNEIVEAALDKAQMEVGTASKSVALETIAQNYVAPGISFTEWQTALTYASKHSDQPAEFIASVIVELENLFPVWSID